MSGGEILLIICVVGGAIFGIFSSMSKDSEINPGQGCLGGALMGGLGGLGCIGAILYTLLPLAIAFFVLSWLFNGCS